jgi:hypothetical protein
MSNHQIDHQIGSGQHLYITALTGVCASAWDKTRTESFSISSLASMGSAARGQS